MIAGVLRDFGSALLRGEPRRFGIAGVLERVFEYDRWVPTRGKVYVLEGTQCKGSSCGERGPCDRACALLWHEDWLVIDDAAAADAEAHG